jgi:hypothetical protein
MTAAVTAIETLPESHFPLGLAVSGLAGAVPSRAPSAPSFVPASRRASPQAGEAWPSDQQDHYYE